MPTNATLISGRLIAALVLAMFATAYAEGPRSMTMPQTVQEHRDRAAEYQKKAADARQDAEAHRKMLADYSKTVAKSPKAPTENPYIKEMRLHCEKYIEADEALAREADEMAKFHEMRAKEAEGK